MSRYIDADALKEMIHYTDDFYETPYVEWEDIVLAPTVDAVPVVRCRDCKRWTSPIPIEMKEEGYGYCGVLWTNTHKDDFCAWGERRSDGNTTEKE